MHGLVFIALRRFLTSAYGVACWAEVCRAAGIDSEGFGPMGIYDPARLDALAGAAATRLRKPREAIMEDLGTFLVFDPDDEAIRRLLRFGGHDFVAFLHSLEDLPDRACLAVADLKLPDLTLEEGDGEFRLDIAGAGPLLGHTVLGLLRAMADDYGDLVLLDPEEEGGTITAVHIRLAASRFAAGRAFSLTASERRPA